MEAQDSPKTQLNYYYCTISARHSSFIQDVITSLEASGISVIKPGEILNQNTILLVDGISFDPLVLIKLFPFAGIVYDNAQCGGQMVFEMLKFDEQLPQTAHAFSAICVENTNDWNFDFYYKADVRVLKLV